MGRETDIGVEEELIHLTKRLAFRIRRELDQVLGAEGVTWAQFTYLRTVYEKRADTPSRIARLFSVATGAITRLTDRLERGGFLLRRASKGDRRLVRIVLTEKGRRLVEALAPAARGQISRLCGKMNQAELKNLTQLMKELLVGGEGAE